MTEMEDRLSRVLRERADAITTPPAYRLAPMDETDDLLSPRRPNRHTPRGWRFTLGAVAAAAAVVIALVVTTHTRHAAPAAGQVCALAHSPGFGAAVRAGALPAGTTVLSGAPDGRELIAVQRPGAPTRVEVVAPDGTTEQLWTARPGEQVRVTANPSGAISPTLIVFEVTRPGSASAQVFVVTRRGRVLAVPTADPGYALVAGPLTAPTVTDDQVSVLERSIAPPARQQVVGYWTEPAPWQRTLGGQVSRAAQLLEVGGDAIVRRRLPGGRVDLAFLDPANRPTTLDPAARAGRSFTTDGTTLRWLTGTVSGSRLWSWRPGQPAPRHQALPAGFVPQAASSNALVPGRMPGVAGQVVVDAGGGEVVALPRGMQLVRGDGPYAIVAARTAAGTTYSRVPAAALTDCAAPQN